MRPFPFRGALGAAAYLAMAASAGAHVTFETAQGVAGATYKAVLRIPHGCAGQATRAVRVEIPGGLSDVKPMPKPGWHVRTERGASPKPEDGKPAPESVLAIVWEGGELPDEHYDEFLFRARISPDLAGMTVPVQVIQHCATATEHWVEVAREGQDPHSLRFPAPTIRVAKAEAPTPAVFKAGVLTVSQPWSRATPGGAKVAVGYMRIVNGGTEPDRLVGGSFAAAGRLELHDMQVGADNVMRMRPVEGGLEIKPGTAVELKPGGYHAMFLDLLRPLREGETLKGTLRFEKAGIVDITYNVRSLGAQSAAEGGHAHH